MRTATAKNVWYYRDRMSVPRGPCTLPVLREAWVRQIGDHKFLHCVPKQPSWWLRYTAADPDAMSKVTRVCGWATELASGCV